MSPLHGNWEDLLEKETDLTEQIASKNLANFNTCQ